MKRAYFKHIKDGTPVVALEVDDPKAGANWYRANPAYQEIDYDEWQRLHDAHLREMYPDSNTNN
ncbi:MAG: hypothetical protein ACXWQ5_00625 [Ktedonobacterales bacterium]